ncbi:MAG: proline racemase family protein [Pseudomonadota bacterium]
MHIIDSHTGGEPTRVILDGGPDLGEGSISLKHQRLAAEHDDVRLAAVSEPRGGEALVGALLCASKDRTCTAGVIFFNEAGYLGMCGHATMGLVVSLNHLGRIGLGRHRFETPVGVVTADLRSPHEVSVENVESYRFRSQVEVETAGFGTLTGDIAWGGNWFFLASKAPAALVPQNIPTLLDAGRDVRRSLARAGIKGAEGAEIDHVEFFGPGQSPGANARNFVLCPDGAYDRSPCGTGTSAKLACLAADGALGAGKTWVQESILGSRFEARYRPGRRGGILPTITGHAYVTAEGRLLRTPEDPFANGIRTASYSLPAAAH